MRRGQANKSDFVQVIILSKCCLRQMCVDAHYKASYIYLFFVASCPYVFLDAGLFCASTAVNGVNIWFSLQNYRHGEDFGRLSSYFCAPISSLVENNVFNLRTAK